MTKRKRQPAKRTIPVSENGINYASKPLLLGAVVKNIIDTNGLDEKIVAKQMGITLRTLRNWYTREYLLPDIMFDLSAVLGENLFAHYHPNLKPKPDPAVELRKELAAERQEIIRLENELRTSRELGIKQDGVIEALKELLADAVKRKGG